MSVAKSPIITTLVRTVHLLLLFWSLRDLNVSSLLNDYFVATVMPSKVCFVTPDKLLNAFLS